MHLQPQQTRRTGEKLSLTPKKSRESARLVPLEAWRGAPELTATPGVHPNRTRFW